MEFLFFFLLKLFIAFYIIKLDSIYIVITVLRYYGITVWAHMIIFVTRRFLVRFASASEGVVPGAFCAPVAPLPPLVLVTATSLAAAPAGLVSPSIGTASTVWVDVSTREGGRASLYPWLP